MDTSQSGTSQSGVQRSGILAGGSWIVDQVKIIDTYPSQDQLANIFSETEGTGGSPFNILIDLSRLNAKFPLEGCGKIGTDSQGDWIIDLCQSSGISTKLISKDSNASTSYTDVFTVKSSGRRTFFHQRGANATWDGSELDLTKTKAKIFHIGYLLLLDALDEKDEEFGTKAARLLNRAQEAGLKTSIDVVSEDSDRFAAIVNPSLKFTDYAILNEIEAGKTTGFAIRESDNSLNKKALEKAVDAMFDEGVKELVVVHFPEGAYAKSANGEIIYQPSLNIPDDYIKGGAGAGDAFCAGTLLGIHDDLPLEKSLQIGVGAAATCLSHPTCTEGVGSLTDIESLIKEFGFRAEQ